MDTAFTKENVLKGIELFSKNNESKNINQVDEYLTKF